MGLDKDALQLCNTGSPQLFVMVVNIIINSVVESRMQ